MLYLFQEVRKADQNQRRGALYLFGEVRNADSPRFGPRFSIDRGALYVFGEVRKADQN